MVKNNHTHISAVSGLFRDIRDRSTTIAKSALPQQFIAVQSFTGTKEGMLSFKAGDTITASSNQKNMDWWFGYCKGDLGWFPTHCVQSKPTKTKECITPALTDCQHEQQRQKERATKLLQAFSASPPATSDELPAPQVNKQKTSNKFLARMKEATREGAKKTMLVIVNPEAGATKAVSRPPRPPRPPTRPQQHQQHRKTALQLAMEQESMQRTTQQIPVMTYKLQTQLPPSLQQRIMEQDQQTLSSHSSSDSDRSNGVEPLAKPILGMTVSYY